MPGRQQEDWGIPLWQAIERWMPRELWKRYDEIAEYDIPLIIPGGREDPRSDEARRLHSRISEILVSRLTRGELIASGIAVPLKETARRRDIRPELWPLLGFNSKFQMMTGNRLRYDQILIREASSVSHEVPASRPQASPPRAPARPGRPSVMPMIEAEMRRRAIIEQIESSLRREAEVLAIWASQELPNVHVPKPESIEKKLGRIYKGLKATKRPDRIGRQNRIDRSFVGSFCRLDCPQTAPR
jgi:hypothetical protein